MQEQRLFDPASFYVRALSTILMAAGVVAVALVSWYVVDAIFLLFEGLLVAILLGNLSRLICRYTPLTYGWALTLVVLTITALLIGFVVYLAPTSVQDLVDLRDELTSALQKTEAQLPKSKWAQNVIKQAKGAGDWSQWIDGASSLRFLGITLSWTVGSFLYLVIICCFGIYLAAEPEMYLRGVVSFAPPRLRHRFREVLLQVGDSLLWWIIGRLSAMTMVGAFSALGLWLLGIPFPITLGVVAGLLTYIPNLGPTLGLIPALLLAFQQGPQMALYVFVFYVTLQSLELYVITPLVQRQGAKLPPVVTIGSQVLMGSVTGILGLTVATPLALAVMVLIKELYIKDTLGQASAQVIASAASDGSLSHGE